MSDVMPAANTLLAHRYPGVPNLGDFTRTDWSIIQPVDVLTAGWPCQPFQAHTAYHHLLTQTGA